MPQQSTPSIQLQPTKDLDRLRQQVQDELNKVLAQVNAARFQSNLDMNFNRINRVQDGVEDFDAVNVSQLRKWAPLIFAGRRRGAQAPRSAPQFEGAVLNFGMFSLVDLELPGNPHDLHALTLSVDETTMDVDRGTSTATVTANQTAIVITTFTAAAGDYVLLHDPSQNGTSAVTNDEIVFVQSVNSGTYTVVRGRWGSANVAHSAGIYAFPLVLRHFSDPGQTNFNVGDRRVDEPARFDCLLPSHCVVSCKAFAANDAGVSPTATRFLPVYGTDAFQLPLTPGLRTLTGDETMLPHTITALATGTNLLSAHVKVPTTASIRCIYAYVDTAPDGDDIEIDVKLDDGAGVYADLDTLTIADGDFENYASGNEPRLRRMPYGIAWANLTPLRQDYRLQIDINSVGSTTPGGKLMVKVQT